MKKGLCYLVAFIVFISAVGVGIHAYANAHKEKAFIGIDGKKIIVHSDNFSAADAAKTNENHESIKAGDIIGENTEKEIVIGVSADGQFITMPLADYESEQEQ